MNDDIRLYGKITKKDNDKRLVSGYVSTEALDSQGEVVEKEAVAKALPGYLGDYDHKTGRYRYGNLREMHQLSAVGKTMKAKVDDKGVYVEGKVIDDNAWKKVKEGVYTGFSIGGKVLQQVSNRIKALRLTEISLVDRPANPEAVFAMVKADKSGRLVDILSPMNLQQGPMETNYEDPQKEEDHPPINIDNDELTDAQIVIHLAADVRHLINAFEMNGKPISDLERALNTLKNLAAKILTEEKDKKKFEDVLYGINFVELEKEKLPFKNRKDMPKGEFAYVDSKGGKHLPIHDESHVRNAMARWNQTQFESPEKKHAAAKKILAAAKRHGIEIDETSAIAQSAKKAEGESYIPNVAEGDKIEDISKYINRNWTTGYFEQMRKVMG